MIQRLHAGDLVRIAGDLGEMMSHFHSGVEAIVTGSYRDLYESHGSWGDNDERTYSLYLEHVGGAAWYYDHQLTLIETGRFDLWEKWRNARRQEFLARMGNRVAGQPSEQGMSDKDRTQECPECRHAAHDASGCFEPTPEDVPPVCLCEFASWADELPGRAPLKGEGNA